MKMAFIGFCICLLLVSAGCNSKAVPVALATTCDKSHDDMTVEISGYFKKIGMTMCSKRGNEPMRCPIDFAESPDSKDGIVRAEIVLGSGGNSVEDKDGKDLIIHDKDGAAVESSQKVKLTADVTVLDTPRQDKTYQDCFVVVKNIEKVK